MWYFFLTEGLSSFSSTHGHNDHYVKSGSDCQWKLISSHVLVARLKRQGHLLQWDSSLVMTTDREEESIG